MPTLCHPRCMANSESGDSVTDRIVRVLETFTPTRTVQSAAEIGRRTGLPTSSAHRIVGDLIEAGLLERDDDRRVRIGLRLWELATRSSHALRLRQLAMPAMERVQARVREHTQLAILEQDEALFLERLSGPGSGSNVTRIAGRLPAARVLVGARPARVRRPRPAGADPRGQAHPGRPRDHHGCRDPASQARRGPPARTRCGTGLHREHRDGCRACRCATRPGTVIAALSVVLPREAPVEPALVELHGAAREIERALGFRG